MYPISDPTAWILARRPARAAVDPWKPNGFFTEDERSADGKVLTSATILLANKECPWRCLMCDLWQHTLPESVPLDAIPAQIDYALRELTSRAQQVKLYNSGSFFDPAAIPLFDYAAIAQRLAFAENLVVESHPRLIGEKALRLSDLFSGSLEVAMGLETVHPEVLPRLNKRFTLKQFEASAYFLRQSGIQVRAFVLVQPPFIEEHDAVEWAVKSARFAFDCGAGVVSLIPTRPGNGALDELVKSGDFSPPTLSTLEDCFEACLKLRAGRVFADTWDLERFSLCEKCFERRRQRLHAMNLSQVVSPRLFCAVCTRSKMS